MSFNKFQTEWVFSHLLFPNSAQARDVFTYVTDDFLLSRKSENKNLVFFKKFVSIYLKTNTVQSNLFFSEFPQDNLKIWPLSFKKLSKEEIIILLGLTVYKLPITEISVAFNYSHLQIKNKIKKAIDIVSPKPENRLRKKYEFQHRKYDSGVQSDFFAYDSAMQLVFNENFTHDEPLKNKIQIEKKILEDSVFKN